MSWLMAELHPELRYPVGAGVFLLFDIVWHSPGSLTLVLGHY